MTATLDGFVFFAAALQTPPVVRDSLQDDIASFLVTHTYIASSHKAQY